MNGNEMATRRGGSAEELGLIDDAYGVLSFPSFYFMAPTLARSDKQALWMRGRRGFKSRLSATTWAMIANVRCKAHRIIK